MSKMLKLLQETKEQYDIEFAGIDPNGGNANIITAFFQFDEQLDKMIYIYTRLEKIRNEAAKKD